MNYTREQLEVMSDFEVNKAIVEKFKGKYDGGCGGSAYYIDRITGQSKSFNFVSWEQIMPLAMGYGVSLCYGSLRHTATDNCEAFHDIKVSDAEFNRIGYSSFSDKSPQRAIACCLLMMDLGEKK